MLKEIIRLNLNRLLFLEKYNRKITLYPYLVKRIKVNLNRLLGIFLGIHKIKTVQLIFSLLKHLIKVKTHLWIMFLVQILQDKICFLIQIKVYLEVLKILYLVILKIIIKMVFLEVRIKINKKNKMIKEMSNNFKDNKICNSTQLKVQKIMNMRREKYYLKNNWINWKL